MDEGESDRLELVVYADHNQFYVVDDATEGFADEDAGDPEALSSRAALEERLGVEQGTLAVYTATYGYVRVLVERADEAPSNNLGRFDHVVEAPFAVTSGRIAVLEETNPRGTLIVGPGTYCARVGWRGVADAEDAYPTADDPVETILIQLWPGTAEGRRVLKWYPDWKPADERPENPYGLRVLVGRECDELEGARIVGDPKDAREFDDRSLVRDATGTYWLSFCSDQPPYSEVMLELPESALGDFKLRPQPPRDELDDDHVRETIALPARERYRYFLGTVTASGWLWDLAGDGGVWQDDEGRSYALVWPHRRFAELYAGHEELEGRPADRERESWLETLERYHDFVAVFPTSMFDTGVVVPASELREELRSLASRR